MLIKYRIEEIPDKGRGVIAAERIPKGTPIWSKDAAIYFEFKSRAEFDKFAAERNYTKEDIAYFVEHAYGFGGNILFL
jgi:hypothetical protein